MRHARLFTPGPTAVPSEVLEVQGRPLVHHRTETFRTAFADVMAGLQAIMRTRNPVVVLAASGSGAMDAVVANLTAPGEKVIVTEIGKFSGRWKEIAQAYGMDVVTVEADWGKAVTPEQVAEAFKANPEASVLLTTHSETSTGVLQDVAEFARITHAHGALIAVDGITGIACHEVDTDGWGLDALVGGSQKGVMIPPGLSYVALSERARKRLTGSRHSVYYFDLAKAVLAAAKNDTPWTPAISLVFALQRALELILDEGLEQVIERHAVNAGATRAAVTALGFDLFAAQPQSNATTVVVVPDGRAGDITKTMEHRHGIKIAGGQAHLNGKIVRIGHLGYYYRTDMFTMMSAFEATLRDLNLTTAFGAGLAAMDAYYETHAGGDAR